MPGDNPFCHNIIHAVERTIRAHRMLQTGDAVLLGVSGGPDSTALAHIMADIAPRLGLTLGAAHLNHALRGKDADRDARFASDLAEKMGMPFFMERKNVRAYGRTHKLSPEDAARQVRYDFFFRVMRENGFTRLALGHHADDNAELILMNLMRGCGLSGLGGMPAVREDGVIRPLIRQTKSDILSYLAGLGADFVTDASNTDMRFTRNRIRNRLLPMIREQFNPNIVTALNRLARLSTAEEAWAETAARQAYADCLASEADGLLCFSAEKLAALHPAACKRVIRMAVRRIKGDLKGVSLSHVSAVEQMIRRHPKNGELHLSKEVRVRADGDELCVMKTAAAPADAPSFEYLLAGPGALFIPEIKGRLIATEHAASEIAARRHSEKNIAFFDRDAVSFPMVVRNWKSGDRFHPLGMKGRQKLSDMFINNKIPQDQRRNYPIIISNEDIIWIGGLRTGNAGKITSVTVNVLKLELLLA